MRREWLMVLLVVVLLMPVGCGSPANAETKAAADALSDTETYTIQVEPTFNQPPKAVFSTPITSSDVGETVSFSAAGSTDPDGYIVKYEWDFGDGTTGEGLNVTHDYAAPGNYKVTLKVTDNGGATSTTALPSAQGTGMYTVKSGDTLMEISRKHFNGDPQYWDEIANLNKIKDPNRIYVGQTLVLPEGASLIPTATPTAPAPEPGENQPPTAVISGPTSGPVGEALNFSGAGSTDPDGYIVKYEWDLGDGTTGSGVNVTHSYGAADSYNVTLTVTDDGGSRGSATRNVQVTEQGGENQQPPKALISGPPKGSVGEVLNFSAAGSYDDDGNIVSYKWDFGDGTTGSGINVTHSYGTADTYNVILTVTDDDGLSDIETHYTISIY
jgi:PKD repeat protein